MEQAPSRVPPPRSVGELRDAHRKARPQLLTALQSDGDATPRSSRCCRRWRSAPTTPTQDLLQNCGTRPAGRRGAGRRGRLRPRRAVSALGRRRAAAAARRHLLRPRRRAQAPGRALHQRCWDIGLEIGSSVRTVEECLAEAASDVTVQTSLLESRLVTGSRKLFATFQERFLRADGPAAFFTAKTLEMRQRHQQVREHALLAGAQLQGIPRRPARPAGDPVGGQRGRLRQAAGTSSRARAGHPPSRRARSSATRRC